MSEESELIQNLFRQEFAKMVAVISKMYGLQYIEIAEDIVSETFLQATESWEQKGIPPNPTAWLYAVAKQKTLYHFRRNKIFDEKVLPAIKAAEEKSIEPNDVNFSEQNIKDSQLQMMFAVCNPAIASEAQIGLALRVLCGFNIEEIAEAFLTNKETINKRLYRAKEKLREANIRLEFPSKAEANHRLDNVLHIIYLLFNEGYYSTTQDQIVRQDFCAEALRLALLLTEYENTNQPQTNALIALICFHSSRFGAREAGNYSRQSLNNYFVQYDDQDEKLWNQELINKGIYYLELSAQGQEISSYHLEAGIAFWHCQKNESKEKWSNILQHYDLLLQINYSPVVALNRAYALYKTKGKKEALKEVESLQLTNNHFYFTLLGELYTGIDNQKALINFEKAYDLARTETDRQTMKTKVFPLNAKNI